MKKGPLSEVEKVKILTSIASLHSPKYKKIGEAMNRSPGTIKKFNYLNQKRNNCSLKEEGIRSLTHV